MPISTSRTIALGAIDGVQRAHYQVAGERSLRGDLASFLISNFSHQHHVRILPQDGAECGGEGEPSFGIDRDLIAARELVLNRVAEAAHTG